LAYARVAAQYRRVRWQIHCCRQQTQTFTTAPGDLDKELRDKEAVSAGRTGTPIIARRSLIDFGPRPRARLAGLYHGLLRRLPCASTGRKSQNACAALSSPSIPINVYPGIGGAGERRANRCHIVGLVRHGADQQRGAALGGRAAHRMALYRAGQGRCKTPSSKAFNGRLRDECLNEHVFTTLAEADASSRLGASTTT
jgi:hypothetical protein